MPLQSNSLSHEARVQTKRKRSDSWMDASDQGSGTMMGVVLVLVAAVVLSCVAGVGNVLNVRTHARSVSDLSALAAAKTLYSSAGFEDQACGMAAQTAQANGLTLDSCVRQGNDMVISVTASTLVPFVPTVSSSSVAGPRDCE